MSEETYTSPQTSVLIVDETAGQFNVLAQLAYDKRDAYAVSLTFTERGEVNPWMLSRDVLIKCVFEGQTAGEGDFVIEVNKSFPVTDMLGIPQETCLMHITGRDDEAYRATHAHGVIRRDFLQSFLARTLEMVPQGSESQHYDIDALIKELTSADD